MLTGELPLGRFPLPSHKVTIDVRLDDIVIRTLEKEPDRRYQAASELRTAVENVATTPTPVQRVEQTKDARRSWSPLRWVGAIAAACIVLFAGLSVSLLLSGRHVEIRDPAGDPVPGQALQQARKGTLPAGFSLGPELEGQIAEALRAYWAASPAAPRASVLAQIAPDLLRSGSQVSRLAALGYVFAHGDARDDTDPVRRYDELESRSVEPLELGGEGEVAALRITPDSEAVRGLREELRSRIVGQVGPTLFSREELDAVLFDRMPFDAGPIEIRIARRGAGWHVERRTKSGVSAETFPDLPPRYGRLMDRSLERAPQLQDPMSAPLTASGAQKGVFAPRPQGLGTAHALAWSRAERIVARSATSLLERYGALEAAHASMTEEVVGPTSTVRVKIEEFAAERAALTAELWTILTHAMEQDEVVRVMQLDFDRAVFPYGDQVFDITMTREGEGFRLVERSADGHFDGSFWVKEYPARMRRLLERPK